MVDMSDGCFGRLAGLPQISESCRVLVGNAYQVQPLERNRDLTGVRARLGGGIARIRLSRSNGSAEHRVQLGPNHKRWARDRSKIERRR